MNQAKWWDEYEIKARYIPCFVATVFPVHFAIQFLGHAFWQSLAKDVAWLVVANLTLPAVVTLALIQVQCAIAKHWVEEGVFGKGGINFPTTAYLLFQDSFLSGKVKLAIREKVLKDFNFALMDVAEEKASPQEARKVAREAVGFIRRSVGKGAMTHQYNIRYGFVRNLVGGAPLGFFGSVGCVIWYGANNNLPAFLMFTFFAIFFTTLVLFRETFLVKVAHQYAEVLFNEYMMAHRSIK
ncbi:hypothetical protein [Geomesophilobacter sediminis]|uniref:Uncharacterized protein n=1 Tax=Geomesophilobacter sediminis TaxID=2798584 RepID=A0A8J7LUV6_9BACT|nr:hypothetical protein [Geomesophilobacter sediminis]MBJ6724195.1 hypothetical protein [Geomesophilobacter sediminis]